jgi:hypothetical protein
MSKLESEMTNVTQIQDGLMGQDPERPKQNFGALFSCKQLYNEGCAELLRKFCFVNVKVYGSPKLCEALEANVIGIRTEAQGSSRCEWYDGFSLRLNIFRGSYTWYTEYVVMGLTSTRDLAIAIAAGRVVGESYFGLPVREEYHYHFHLQVPSQSARRSVIHMGRETEMLQPFIDFFWNGFDDIEVYGAAKTVLVDHFKKSTQQDRWTSADEFVEYLEQALLLGEASYMNGELHTAYDVLREANEVRHMTKCSRQKPQDFHNRRFRAYGKRLDKATWKLRDLISTILLCWAEESQSEGRCTTLAAKAYEYCKSMLDCRDFVAYEPGPTTQSPINLKISQTFRLRGTVAENLEKAERYLKTASLNSKDPSALIFHDEAAKLTEVRCAELTKGKLGVLE